MKKYISLFILLFVFNGFSQEKNDVIRSGGVKFTVKDGIIYDAKRLLVEVKQMVDEKKLEENWELKQPGIK